MDTSKMTRDELRKAYVDACYSRNYKLADRLEWEIEKRTHSA